MHRNSATVQPFLVFWDPINPGPWNAPGHSCHLATNWFEPFGHQGITDFFPGLPHWTSIISVTLPFGFWGRTKGSRKNRPDSGGGALKVWRILEWSVAGYPYGWRGMLSWAPGREVQTASFPCSRQGTQRFVFSCSKDEISEVISDIFFCLILETWKLKQPNGLGGVAGLTKTQKRSGLFGNYFAKPIGWKRSALVSSKTFKNHWLFCFRFAKKFQGWILSVLERTIRSPWRRFSTWFRDELGPGCKNVTGIGSRLICVLKIQNKWAHLLQNTTIWFQHITFPAQILDHTI